MMNQGNDGNGGKNDGGGDPGKPSDEMFPAIHPNLVIQGGINPAESPTGSGPSNQQAQEIVRAVRRFARWGMAISGGMLIATIAQAIIGFYELRAIGEANRVAKMAADAATIAADAAVTSNQQSKKASETQLRAWLGIEESIMEWVEETSLATLTLPVKNYGQTPALSIVSIAEVWRSDDKPAPLVCCPEDELTTISGPGHVENYLSQFTVTAEDKVQFDAGKLHFVIGGCLEYIDVFGNDRLNAFQLKWARVNGEDQLSWDFQVDESEIDSDLLADYYRERAEDARKRHQEEHPPREPPRKQPMPDAIHGRPPAGQPATQS